VKPEDKARLKIDGLLRAAGWSVQDYQGLNLGASLGVVVRNFPLKSGFGFADYLLFVDRRAVGVLEAKPEGSTLSGVAEQSGRYAMGLPDIFLIELEHRILKELEQLRITQHYMVQGLDIGGYLHFDKTYVENVHCHDDVDKAVLNESYCVGASGILPKDLANALEEYKLDRWQVCGGSNA